MDTLTIDSWADLRPLGINCLTGESCAYALRVLCDLNEDGAAVMREYLGVVMLARNWNSTVGDKPAVASVMLHRESLFQVGEFALMYAGALAVIRTGNHMVGVFSEERLVSYLKVVEICEGVTIKRNYRTAARGPVEGSRMVHAATGRSA
jgi:hypothetical protein